MRIGIDGVWFCGWKHEPYRRLRSFEAAFFCPVSGISVGLVWDAVS